MRTAQLLAVAVAVSSVSAAWSDNVAYEVKNILYGRGEEARNVLYGRQNDQETSQGTATNTPTNAPESSSNPRETRSSMGASRTTNSGSVRPTGSVTITGSATRKSKEPTFAADRPAGGISMITPAALAGTPFYKVGEWVTLAWNYTSVSKYPNRIDIMATCTKNQATYTLAVNQSVEETGGAIIWDTQGYQDNANVPLLTEMYTLMIYDSESSPSAAPRPGYLGTAMGLQFGIYTGQPYKDWDAGYTCPTCNSGLSAFEALTLKALLVTCGTTVFSLIYFAFSFGVL